MTASPSSSGYRPILHVGLTVCGAAPADPWTAQDVLAALSDVVRSVLRSDHPGTAMIEGPPVLRLIGDLTGFEARKWGEVAEAQGWETPPVRSSGAESTAIDALILDQSDLIVAIGFDRARELSWLIREARDSGIPVIAVEAGTAAVGLVEGGGAWRATVEAEIARLLLPGGGATGAEASKAVGEIRAFEQDRPPAWVAHHLYRAYQRLLLVVSRSAAEARLAPVSPSRLGASAPPGPVPALEIADVGIARMLDRADRLAGAYADLYRVAAILRSSLGLVAILGSFLAFYYGSVMHDLGRLVGWSGGATLDGAVQRVGYVIDMAAILAVLAISALADKRNWHRRFVAYRYIAEHLRWLPIQAVCAVTRVRSRTRPFAPQTDWPSWLVRATARRIGPPAASLTPEVLASAQTGLSRLLSEQIGFYESRARVFNVIAHRLSVLANTCYWLGLAALLARFGVRMCCETNDQVLLLANMACLFFPALAPVFLGLRSQGEYAKLAQRYSAMAATLTAAEGEIGREMTGAPAFTEVTRRITTTLLDEVEDWQILIKSHEISRM